MTQKNPSTSKRNATVPTTSLLNRTVWVVRHGSRMDMEDPKWATIAERPYDSPLSAKGFTQANDLGKWFARETIHHIFCSPFIRTVQTAITIAKHSKTTVRVENGLSELLLANWFPVQPELLSLTTLREHYPCLDPHYTSTAHPTYPETEDQMRLRTAGVVKHLLDRFEGNLLLVAHGASMIGITHALVSGYPPISTLLAGLVQISGRDGTWTLIRDGSDTSHLSQPG